jgi:hypothetical protein
VRCGGTAAAAGPPVRCHASVTRYLALSPVLAGRNGFCPDLKHGNG